MRTCRCPGILHTSQTRTFWGMQGGGAHAAVKALVLLCSGPQLEASLYVHLTFQSTATCLGPQTPGCSSTTLLSWAPCDINGSLSGQLWLKEELGSPN